MYYSKHQIRPLLIATMHGKEKVIFPILSKVLPVSLMKNTTFDTDQFGTFSGEIERVSGPIETLKKKCYSASNLFPDAIICASEGSFGSHPFLPVPMNEEFIMLYDPREKLEIIAKVINLKTNISQKEIRTTEELLTFAKVAKFPSHRLILKVNDGRMNHTLKGINKKDDLLNAFNRFKEKGKVIVETDMRAMYNPTRMENIGLAAKELVKKYLCKCPECLFPGFDVIQTVSGLPCQSCGNPTESILKLIYSCKNCKYSEQRFFPRGKKTEEAQYCNVCNP